MTQGATMNAMSRSKDRSRQASSLIGLSKPIRCHRLRSQALAFKRPGLDSQSFLCPGITGRLPKRLGSDAGDSSRTSQMGSLLPWLISGFLGRCIAGSSSGRLQLAFGGEPRPAAAECAVSAGGLRSRPMTGCRRRRSKHGSSRNEIVQSCDILLSPLILGPTSKTHSLPAHRSRRLLAMCCCPSVRLENPACPRPRTSLHCDIPTLKADFITDRFAVNAAKIPDLSECEQECHF